MSNSNSNKTLKKGNSWRGLIIWVLIAFLLRWQVIEPRWIPSGSMLPTLGINQRILIEKVSPKVHYFSNKKAKVNQIVVFNPPNELINAGFEANSALIKRIVGVPGDRLQVTNGHLIRNDNEIKEPWILSDMKYEMKLITVPDDSYWVLGDNRNNSLDSHLWGALPAEKIVGTAIFSYWPIKRFGIIRFPPSN